MTMPDKVHFLCSCPEYLHGTGKPTKKKTTCKQCKGVKLPFAPIGGTVRMVSSPYVLDATTARNCVGTVRLPASSSSSFTRQRPTILCGDHDPYDFLRQSRLLLGNDSNETSGLTYPQHYQTIGPSNHALMRTSRSFLPSKAPRIIESFSPLVPDVYRNRSILQTTINPYELISSTLHNNEFSPASHLYDFLQPNGSHNSNNKSNGTVAVRNNYRNETSKFTVMETFASPPTNGVEKAKPISAISTIATCIQPPPLPALENLPLSVKSVSSKILKNMDIVGKAIVSTAAVQTPQTTLATTTITAATQPVTASKFKSILKPSINNQSNGTVNSVTDGAVRVLSVSKVNSKRSLSQPLDEVKSTIVKSSLQKFNPKINGSPTHAADIAKSGIKKIIKEPNRRIESATGTTGRSKKVQFNTEPALERPKSNESSQSSSSEIYKNAIHSRIDLSASKINAASSENIKDIESSQNISDVIEKQRIGLRNELNRGSRRRKPIQRSMSDRRDKDANGAPGFKDTTALRAKAVRASPQQLFQRPISLVCQRPSSPPPKLPTENMRRTSPAIPQRPPRQQKKSTSKLTNGATTTKTIDDSSGARIFGLLPVSTINKNKIKIQAFSSADIKPIVNRQQEEQKKIDAALQKTSIAINGGDCSSTVSVSDRVKLYHSSVLIKNESTDRDDDKKTSGLYTDKSEASSASGNNDSESSRKQSDEHIYDDPATEVSIVYHNSNNRKAKKQEVLETISTNVSKTKTLICLDYKIDADSDEKLPIESDFDSTSVNSTNDVIKSFSFLNDENGNSNSLSKPFADSFILKLLNDPYLGYLLHGLEIKTIAKIIENSLVRLRANKNDINSRSTKDTNETDKLFLNLLHNIIKEERRKVEITSPTVNGNSRISPKRDFIGSRLRSPVDYYQNELIQNNDTMFDSRINESTPVRKLYEMLVDSTFWKNGDSSSSDSQSDHQYESICLNCDPIYEEINDKPPPLPLNPPPTNDELKNKHYKSMFLGATKYDILSYLVDAKERGIVPEESYSFKFLRRPNEESTGLQKIPEDNGKIITIVRNRGSTGSSGSNSDKQSLTKSSFGIDTQKCMASIERNDSGVGSETSKTSRTKYQPSASIIEHKSIPPIHLCEDCDDPIELQMLETPDIYTPIVCRKCGKKRAERREILAEFFETEEKYSRDLQIIIDEFYQPMLVAGLLTQEQLSAIFLNIEELLENSQAFCEKIRDAFYVALEQGDDDLFTVDIGKIILETSSMLCAFESYCIQQAAASLLLANMEKDKELLRIFLRVSQMENTVLRRMNLNSFLMVPVQRVTKYPLLLARLYKVTPTHLESRERLKEAQDKIECHLNRMNREAKDISTKLWRRLSSNPTLRTARETDIINIKLRKIAIDLLEWNHEKVHFVVEGKLLITQPTDNNWRKGRTIKLTPVNALLITNELASTSDTTGRQLSFPRHSPNKEATLLLVREKSGRYNLYREPLYLDRCVICTESECAEYFEVHEISSKDSFIFKAEDDARTKHWYSQLQYHAQGTGAWRKRRTALANIMINGMMLRS